MADAEVVVVGAGSAGCPLAVRLAEAGRQVLLLEAGGEAPPDLRGAGSLPVADPAHPAAWDVTAELPDGRSVHLPRGRVLGGSSAINGGYFVRGTPADFAGWAAAGNDLWSFDAVLPAFRRLEDDRDHGSRPGHGTGGPVPVQRPLPGSPVVDAFAAAVEALGFPAEPDKNAGGDPGWGPIPMNVADGVRVDAATAYLRPRPGLTVRSGVQVRRVLVDRGRAVGVETDDGVVRADEVVLSAGAVGSPHLLLLSGLGPADVLRAAGLDVVVDLPGVGADVSDHPDVYLSWTPSRPLPLPLPPAPAPLHSALNTGDLELQPWLTPFPAVGTGDDMVLRVALQAEQSRGRLVLDPADRTALPRIEQRYLTAEADRRRLRDGVRLAVELLRSPAVAALVARHGGPPDDVLADDAALDGWLRRSIGTAVHLCGSARMGPESDDGAVVDQHLRVRGVDGLRVVDTSVLPWAPSRGPAATAVLIGERAAELMLG